MTPLKDNNPNPDGVAPPNGSESKSERKLNPEHLRALVEGSAIAPEVVTERGYFTATDAAELRDLGFAGYQRRVPALVLPVRGVDGSLRFHRVRPDDPRENAEKPGKYTKYEQPAQTGIALDVPPGRSPRSPTPASACG